MQQAKKHVPKNDGGRHTAARRLWETASDELVRWAVKLSTTGIMAWVTYWIDHH
ncbi:hypothetical protein [Streptomyces sp. TLI_105]|uniref:hypothetical protein n=1 Tax=Streptomyces sp. TLI_105 TaxID=1881019 RepID=UPI0008956B4D|nr:hypothetical protein [Streptomyces sp. TLI_105]SEB78558.1 hypothetical protein SAMN05428939_0708 [Streptomyces sp. TLI_105]